MSPTKNIRHAPWFDTLYRVGVMIKGLDGLVEFATGILLLFAPGTVHMMLSYIIGTAHHHEGHTAHFIAEHVARVDSDIARSGLTFLIIFLISHGAIKLILVYCLLRRVVWAYPYAVSVLVLFLLYQLYVLMRDPLSLGMWLFTILDVIIIWLVWGEWRDLRERTASHSD